MSSVRLFHLFLLAVMVSGCGHEPPVVPAPKAEINAAGGGSSLAPAPAGRLRDSPGRTGPGSAAEVSRLSAASQLSMYFPDKPAVLLAADIERLQSSKAFAVATGMGGLARYDKKFPLLFGLTRIYIRAGIDGVGILQAKRPFTPQDVNSLLAELQHWNYPPEYHAESVKSYTLHVTDFAPEHQPAYCLVGDRVLLLGQPQTLRKVLGRERPPELSEAVGSALTGLDAKIQVVLAIDPKAIPRLGARPNPGTAPENEVPTWKPTPEFPISPEMLAQIATVRLSAWCDDKAHAKVEVRCANPTTAEDLRKLADGLIVTAKQSSDIPKGMLDSVAVSNQACWLTAHGVLEPSALSLLLAHKETAELAERSVDDDLKPDSFYWTYPASPILSVTEFAPWVGHPITIRLSAGAGGQAETVSLEGKSISSPHPFDEVRQGLRRLTGAAGGIVPDSVVRLAADPGVSMRGVMPALGLVAEFNRPEHALFHLPASASFRVQRAWSPPDTKKDQTEVIAVPLQVQATAAGKIAAIILNGHSKLGSDLGWLGPAMLNYARQAVQARVQARVVLDCDPRLTLEEAVRVIAAVTGDQAPGGSRRFIHSVELVVGTGGQDRATVFLMDPSWQRRQEVNPAVDTDLPDLDITRDLSPDVREPGIDARIPKRDNPPLDVDVPDDTIKPEPPEMIEPGPAPKPKTPPVKDR